MTMAASASSSTSSLVRLEPSARAAAPSPHRLPSSSSQPQLPTGGRPTPARPSSAAVSRAVSSTAGQQPPTPAGSPLPPRPASAQGSLRGRPAFLSSSSGALGPGATPPHRHAPLSALSAKPAARQPEPSGRGGTDATEHVAAHHREPLGLGVLRPLTPTVSSHEVQMARPHSAQADKAEAAQRAKAKDRDTLQREEPGGELWLQRQERLAGLMRGHVLHIRARSSDSKSAIAARKKIAAAR